jgi:hypothetical protein
MAPVKNSYWYWLMEHKCVGCVKFEHILKTLIPEKYYKDFVHFFPTLFTRHNVLIDENATSYVYNVNINNTDWVFVSFKEYVLNGIPEEQWRLWPCIKKEDIWIYGMNFEEFLIIYNVEEKRKSSDTDTDHDYNDPINDFYL